jgi:hypothetical protein
MRDVSPGELGQRGMKWGRRHPRKKAGFAPRGAPQRENPKAAWLGTTMPSSSGCNPSSAQVPKPARKTPVAEVLRVDTFDLASCASRSQSRDCGIHNRCAMNEVRIEPFGPQALSRSGILLTAENAASAESLQAWIRGGQTLRRARGCASVQGDPWKALVVECSSAPHCFLLNNCRSLRAVREVAREALWSPFG